MRLAKASLCLVLPLAVIWACGSSSSGDNGGSGADGSGASSANGGSIGLGGDGLGVAGDNTGNGGTTSLGGTTGKGGTTGTAGTGGFGTTQCSDGIDNDGDGLIDGLDPECTGPLDNDESSFATGIPGDNRDPKWQDCFYDGNSGAGDDGCRYATGCLTGDLPQTDKNCQLSDQCKKFCAPLVPNGCDCFGCCTVGPPGATVDIELMATCSLAKLSDTTACPRCIKTTQCGNDCGTCELCAGKTVADLPASCTPSGSGGATGAGGAPSGGSGTTGGGPTYTCDNGEQVCGNGLPGCMLGTYCSLGCCIQQPPR
jgi:hypothetical protein